MEFKDKVYIASKYAGKGLSFEDLNYGDDLYHLDGNPDKDIIIDDIWDLVVEYKEYGSNNFYETYKNYKLY